MSQKVLILGGRGQIGRNVAADLLAHTSSQVTITGRGSDVDYPLMRIAGSRLQYLALDLADRDSLRSAIASVDLAIHCAGPFRQRDASVLKLCIEQGVNYVDVSDDRVFTQAALAYGPAAQAAGVTATINTGVFPGISNSMVRQAVEQLETPEEIHISYVVAGSGGAGVTVMRTTFLNIQHQFDAWIGGQWRQIKPYSEVERIEFPAPFGSTNVYWFDMPESFTLVQTFPVKTVTTKFGTFPDFYNRLTWMTAHLFPKQLMQQHRFIEFLAQVSHKMTDVTDRFSGVGVAVRAEVRGQKEGKAVRYCSTFVHESAAIATGVGAGSVSQLILSRQLEKPGVWPVEQALSTQLFEQMLQYRGLSVHQSSLSS
jgi:saccharopine dehydrogenase-like NADP-dependent oxidoreductase